MSRCRRLFYRAAPAQEELASAGLAYDAQTQGPVPIRPSERALQTVVAKPWFKASGEGRVLEGVIFDRSGNMLFCDVFTQSSDAGCSLIAHPTAFRAFALPAARWAAAGDAGDARRLPLPS